MQTRNLVSKTRNFVLEMMNFVLEMMNFAGAECTATPEESRHRRWFMAARATCPRRALESRRSSMDRSERVR